MPRAPQCIMICSVVDHDPQSIEYPGNGDIQTSEHEEITIDPVIQATVGPSPSDRSNARRKSSRTWRLVGTWALETIVKTLGILPHTEWTKSLVAAAVSGATSGVASGVASGAASNDCLHSKNARLTRIEVRKEAQYHVKWGKRIELAYNMANSMETTWIVGLSGLIG